MPVYKTSEVAQIIGIHPNTVRLYEKLELIPKPERLSNGYRIFTDFHIEQCRLVRIAFKVEVVQNGLRNKITEMIKASASGDFDTAVLLINEYTDQIKKERSNADEAIEIVKQLLSGCEETYTQNLKRSEVSKLPDISMDTLRNWEMNGLLTVKRKENGYRVSCIAEQSHIIQKTSFAVTVPAKEVCFIEAFCPRLIFISPANSLAYGA